MSAIIGLAILLIIIGIVVVIWMFFKDLFKGLLGFMDDTVGGITEGTTAVANSDVGEGTSKAGSSVGGGLRKVKKKLW